MNKTETKYSELAEELLAKISKAARVSGEMLRNKKILDKTLADIDELKSRIGKYQGVQGLPIFKTTVVESEIKSLLDVLESFKKD